MKNKIKNNLGVIMAVALILFGIYSCQHRSGSQSVDVVKPTTIVKPTIEIKPGTADQSHTAEDILEKYIEAVGGRTALRKVHNKKIVSTGLINIGQLTLLTDSTVYQERPNNYYEILKANQRPVKIRAKDAHIERHLKKYNKDLKGRILEESGTDGDVVWEIISKTSTSIIHGTEMEFGQTRFEQGIEEANLKQGVERGNFLVQYAIDALELEKSSISPIFIGTENVKNKPCYKLVITSHEMSQLIVFIEKKSLLLVKYTQERGPKGRFDSRETFLDDYKKVDGILMPHKFEVHRSGRLYRTGEVQSVETNIDIPKERFALPQKIQELAATSIEGDKPKLFQPKEEMQVTTPTQPEAPKTVASIPKEKVPVMVIKTFYGDYGEGKKMREMITVTKVGEIWHGPYRSYYPNGQVMIEENYVMGKIEGPSTHYDENGNMMREESYRNGLLDGSQTFFCKNGNIKIKFNYQTGKFHGRAERYSQCTGILETESFYKNGLLDGEKTVYFLDGKIKEKSTYKNGKPDGSSISYFSNGKIDIKKSFKNGKKVGLWQAYYEDGKKKSEENFHSDHYNGLVKYYYPSGVLREEISYKNGLKHGIKKYYYKNGKVKDEIYYKDDKKNGIKKQYAWSGYLWLEESFKDDVLDGPTKRYDRNGGVIKRLMYRNGKLDE